MQPEDLLAFMSTGKAFVLPSTFEPWGVAVHEFAAAGYPLILSDAVGALARPWMLLQKARGRELRVTYTVAY